MGDRFGRLIQVYTIPSSLQCNLGMSVKRELSEGFDRGCHISRSDRGHADRSARPWWTTSPAA